MSLLTILIPTLDSRNNLLNILLEEIQLQIKDKEGVKIQVLYDHQDLSVGKRRNILLENSDSKYVCFFDDDDMPTKDYIDEIYKAAISSCDCASLKGIYTENGLNPEIFEHSIKYDVWKTNYGVIYPNIKYERTPNHLNLIKRDLAIQVKFEEINFSEDKIWSDKIHKLGLIKTEYYIEKPIYKYLKTT